MAKIEHIQAAEVLDSRGVPTVRVTVRVAGGHTGVATVPSGASTGKYEARELRDGDASRYRGKGVLQAVHNVNTGILAAVVGLDAGDQTAIDAKMIELDGTPNKASLGANAILAVSLAAARAEAASQGLPLYLYLQQLIPKGQPTMPIPQMNLINGGRHANNGMAIQEFHVLPVSAPSFTEALRMGVEVSYALKDLLVEDGFSVSVGDEGGFAPTLKNSDSAFAYLVHAIEKAGYIPGVDVWLGIDAAASEFYDAEKDAYMVDGTLLSASTLQQKYESWRSQYPIISIEDPFDEDAWQSWVEFMENNQHYVQIVGDDLLVTSSARIQRGIIENAVNAVLIKPNQVGTLSETLQAIAMTQKAGMNPIISHRSGETEDSFIADLAVATGAGQIKTGAPTRSERCAKYNRLLEVEQSNGEIPYAKNLQVYAQVSENHYKSASDIGVQRHQ